MKVFLTPVILSFLLIGASFSATSFIDSGNYPKNKVKEKVKANDPARVAIQSFNDGNYLSGVLIAQPLAEEGNPFALLLMGLAYESGNGIKQSNDLALKSFRQAREAGSEEAPYRLASLLVGLGEKNHQKEAQSILEALAKTDDGQAARMLGEGALKGWLGKDPSFENARTWWEESAKKGDVAAILRLPRLLDGLYGFPEKSDPAAALQQYIKGAEIGHSPSMIIAASRLLNGEEKTRNETEARKWLAKAIEKKQWDAYSILGNYAENVTKSDTIAFTEYQKGAEQGHGQCMLKVASFHMEGRGGKEKNPKEALTWFKKAGEAGQVLGHVQAARILMQGEGLNIVEAYNHLLVAAESGLVDMQNELGLLYLSGILGVQDPTAAASWFRRSANGKFPAGAYNLAALLEQGIGVPKNFDQAGRLYTLAANTGHAKSTTALGILHAQGKGTKRDLPRALALFSLAVTLGDTQAEDFKNQLIANLEESDLKKAREILSEYQKTLKPPKDGAGE